MPLYLLLLVGKVQLTTSMWHFPVYMASCLHFHIGVGALFSAAPCARLALALNRRPGLRSTYRFNLLLELDRAQLTEQHHHVESVHQQKQAEPDDRVQAAGYEPAPQHHQYAAGDGRTAQPQEPARYVRCEEGHQKQRMPDVIV